MNEFARLVLTAAALVAATGASAAPFDSADQARRERNREEVLARNGASPSTYRSGDIRASDESSAHKPALRERTHRAATATRNFGHRTADKMRSFGDRQNAKFGRHATPRNDPYKDGK